MHQQNCFINKYMEYKLKLLISVTIFIFHPHLIKAIKNNKN